MDPVLFSHASDTCFATKKLVHTWRVNDVKVSLFQAQELLWYKTIDATNGKRLYKKSLNLQGKTTEQMISRLKQCRVIINEDNSASFPYHYHTWELDADTSEISKDKSNSTFTTEPGCIPFFKEKAGKILDKEIAQHLWLNSEVIISEDMVKKVNKVAIYLKEQGFELRGIKADGNCFCSAFLESYNVSSLVIPILDNQKNQISYLRELIASEYDTAQNRNEKTSVSRVQEIKQDAEWLTADEGDLLAKALTIPIRIVTVNLDKEGCGISDMLTFQEKDKDRKKWKKITELEKPKKYIFIVDFGGHFVYAKLSPLGKIGEFSESTSRESNCQFLTNQLTAKTINLLRGTDNLVWEIFCNAKQSSSFLSFQEYTIPSARCHPETVALIERMKQEAFNNRRHIISLTDDFKVVRVLNKDILQNERDIVYENKKNNLIRHITKQSDKYADHSSVLISILSFLSYKYQPAEVKETLGISFPVFTTAIMILQTRIFAKIFAQRHLVCEYVFNSREKEILLPSKNIFVEIEPKLTAISKMDDRVIVSKFIWSVTLITGPEGWSKNHAAIVVEGLANAYLVHTNPNDKLSVGEYFMHKSEFNPPIRLGIYHEKTYEAELNLGMRKTETWMKSSEKVTEMFQAMTLEMLSNPEKRKIFQKEKTFQGDTVDLSRPGIDSVISRGYHSCFTWAREKLKMLDINLGKSMIGIVWTIPRSYTDEFEEHQKKSFIVQI